VSYRVDNFIDPTNEVSRLRRQAEILEDFEDAAFVQLGLPSEGVALEIGCGPGHFALRLAARHQKLRVLGIDIDDVCLRHARRSVSVAKADGRHLPLRDHCLDLAYARLALRHIAQPESVLQAAHRALKPGRRLIVEDVDDASMVVFPEPRLFRKILAARQEGMRRAGADPHIGRRLLSLIRASGFVDISVVPIPFSSLQLGRGPFAEIVFSAFTAPTLNEKVSAEELEEIRNSIEEWKNNDDSFAMTTALVFGATKPA
jgi:ubiquinone/menaquinone biosynthesis C-methylase UbiE